MRELFSEWLVKHFPDKARHVLSLIRATSDGKLYDSAFDTRMRARALCLDHRPEI